MNNNSPFSVTNDFLLTKDANNLPQSVKENTNPLIIRRGRPPKTPVTPKPIRSAGRPRKTAEQSCKSTIFNLY